MSVAVAMGVLLATRNDVLVCCCKEYYPSAWYVKHTGPKLRLPAHVLPGGVVDWRVGGAAHRGSGPLAACPLADPGGPVLPPRTLVLRGGGQPRPGIGGVVGVRPVHRLRARRVDDPGDV